MKTLHTPGPWTKNVKSGHLLEHKSQEGLMPICYMHLYNNPEQTEANARLIAASPELLEALQLMCKWAELSVVPVMGDEFLPRGYDKVMQTINKATGI